MIQNVNFSHVVRDSDIDSLSSKLTEKIISAIELHPKGEQFHLAISGGSSPEILFRCLRSELVRRDIDTSSLHIWWVDERMVPPDSPESNYGAADRSLIVESGIPSVNIHRIEGETPIDIEVERYRNDILEYVPCCNNTPQFQMILLGIGSDGHTASIFPESISKFESNDICVEAEHPESKQKRISLTGTVINASEEVIFFAPGAGKLPIISEMMELSIKSQSYPASYVLSKRGYPTFYIG